MKTINVKDYCDHDDKVYVLPKYGKRVCERSCIDDLCETEDCITVEFPKSTVFISVGFLEGLFENIALKYGIDGLRKKVRIETHGYDINEQLCTMYSRFAKSELILTETDHDKERSKQSDAVMLRLANVIVAVLIVPVSILLLPVSLVTLPLLALPYWIATGNESKWWMDPAYSLWDWFEQQVHDQRFIKGC